MNLSFIETALATIATLQKVAPAHSVTSFDDVREALPQALYHPVKSVAYAGGINGVALQCKVRFAVIVIADHGQLDAVRTDILNALNGFVPAGATPVRFAEGEVIEAIGQTVVWRDYFEFNHTIGG